MGVAWCARLAISSSSSIIVRDPTRSTITYWNREAEQMYGYSADEVHGVVTQWEDLLHDLRSDLALAHRVAGVTAPGKEFASGHFIQAAGPSGQTLLTQHQRMVTYVQNYIDALNKASGQTQQAEDNAQQAIAQQGQGVV